MSREMSPFQLQALEHSLRFCKVGKIRMEVFLLFPQWLSYFRLHPLFIFTPIAAAVEFLRSNFVLRSICPFVAESIPKLNYQLVLFLWVSRKFVC